MKCRVLLIFVLFAIKANAQLLTYSPAFIKESSTPVEITCDGSLGNAGLNNYTPLTDVYVHLGIITNYSTSASDWKHVPAASQWGTTNAAIQAVNVGTNKWKYTITGGLRTFFNVTDPNETILKIAIIFRNGAGTKQQGITGGGDMYVPVYNNALFARIDNPFRKSDFNNTPEVVTKIIGNNVAITAKSSQTANMTLFFNGSQINSASAATQITGNPVIAAPGTQTIIAVTDNGTTTAKDTLSFFVNGTVNVAALPSGVSDGINYEADATAVTLVLYAPNKTRASVVGDFNSWTETVTHQMNRTPDGNRYWVRITGLTPGTEYGYQYLIDGNLKVADYYTEKVLDPNNDQYISSTTYPALKPYPTGLTTGIVSIFQTQKPAYTWTSTSYTRPDKKNLVVYELLLRDFVAKHDWTTLKDTLSYFQRLGINAIELMPINEFEGNESWGYNPSFYMAPDKYYGTETALKQFIDACHSKGIAVIMDIAMNHSFGQSPMVQMYWDAANNRPAANNPWFNIERRHPYNVGYQFNHESQATKDFVDRVTEHWLTNYKIDGFRWDLSKGFTQVNSCTTANCDQASEINTWGNYDASRIVIWKRIYDKMQTQSSNSYCILEHFANNTEEIELSNYGMMLWGNLNYNFNEASMGWVPTSNFQYGLSVNRGWANPHLVTYQESHDEERLMYKNELYGNSSNSSHNIKNVAVGLKRNEMTTAFWAMMPGPKMLWQFGELGYDSSINYCSPGVVNNSCRLSNKPILWNYYQDANRRSLYNVYAALFKLRTHPSFLSAFTSNNVTYSLGGGVKTMAVSDASLKVFVIGNFDVTAQTTTVTFPAAGLWYNYFTGTIKTATGSAESITLQPGEYYVYTDRNASATVLTINGGTTYNTPPRRDSLGYIDGYKVSIYPNPTTSTPATIQYSLLRSGDLNISLTDINGKPVTTFFNGYKQRGTYSLSTTDKLNLGKIPGGVYLLQTTFDNKRRALKFIVINK